MIQCFAVRLLFCVSLLSSPALGASDLATRQSANAASNLGPSDAIAIALKSNRLLAAGSARIASAEGAEMQAGFRPNPRLYLQSENTRFGAGPAFQYARDVDNFAYASQIFELSGKRARRIDVAAQVVGLNQLALESEKLSIAGRVALAYWAAVSAHRRQEALQQGIQVLERAVQYNRDRVREGSLPEADLIRIDLEYQQVRISYENARQDAYRARQRLFREMGILEQPLAVLNGDLEAVPAVAVEDPDTAVEQRPDVKLARKAIAEAQANVRLQKSNAVPDPDVLLGYKRTAGFNTLIAGVQINLPVRNRNQGAIASANADLEGANATLDATRIAARTEIASLESEYLQKQQVVRDLVPRMRAQSAETIRIADAVYREGASDLLRLLDAQRTRLQTESLYIQTLFDYRQAVVNLQVAAGILP